MAWIKVLESVEIGKENEWRLCFQKVIYNYSRTENEDGYRFIWKTPEGKLQPARGQARIPDSKWIFNLLKKAHAEGWFSYPNNIQL